MGVGGSAECSGLAFHFKCQLSGWGVQQERSPVKPVEHKARHDQSKKASYQCPRSKR